MSVTHFIPSGLRSSRSVKPHAIPVTLRFTPPPSSSHVVTARRPRAVGSPTARRGGLTSRLSPIAAEAVSIGLESLSSLERRMHDVVRDLRDARIDSGRRGLASLVHGTQALVTLATTTATALGEDLDLSAEADGFSAAETTRHVIGRVIAGQTHADWRAVADALERGFPRALAAWRIVFETFSVISPTDDTDPSGYAA